MKNKTKNIILLLGIFIFQLQAVDLPFAKGIDKIDSNAINITISNDTILINNKEVVLNNYTRNFDTVSNPILVNLKNKMVEMKYDSSRCVNISISRNSPFPKLFNVMNTCGSLGYSLFNVITLHPNLTKKTAVPLVVGEKGALIKCIAVVITPTMWIIGSNKSNTNLFSNPQEHIRSKNLQHELKLRLAASKNDKIIFAGDKELLVSSYICAVDAAIQAGYKKILTSITRWEH